MTKIYVKKKQLRLNPYLYGQSRYTLCIENYTFPPQIHTDAVKPPTSAMSSPRPPSPDLLLPRPRLTSFPGVAPVSLLLLRRRRPSFPPPSLTGTVNCH